MTNGFPLLTRCALLGLSTVTAAFATLAYPAGSTAAPASDGYDAGRRRRVQTVRRFFELLGRKDVEAWAELWAENGRIIVFYPPDGFGTSIGGPPSATTSATSSRSRPS